MQYINLNLNFHIKYSPTEPSHETVAVPEV